MQGINAVKLARFHKNTQYWNWKQKPRFVSASSAPQLVANHGIYAMIACAETSQLYLFTALNLLSIAITPFNRNIRVGIRIDKNIECAWLGEFR